MSRVCLEPGGGFVEQLGRCLQSHHQTIVGEDPELHVGSEFCRCSAQSSWVKGDEITVPPREFYIGAQKRAATVEFEIEDLCSIPASMHASRIAHALQAQLTLSKGIFHYKNICNLGTSFASAQSSEALRDLPVTLIPNIFHARS